MTKREFRGDSISATFEITLPNGRVANAAHDVLRGFCGTIDRVINGTEEEKAFDLMNQALDDLRIIKEKLDLELPPLFKN